jgi:hypothetical protein
MGSAVFCFQPRGEQVNKPARVVRPITAHWILLGVAVVTVVIVAVLAMQ